MIPKDEHYIRAAELVARYLEGDISDEELRELMDTVERYPSLRSWVESKDISLEKIRERLTEYQSFDLEKEWQSVLARRDTIRTPMYKKWWAIAASIIAVCLVGGALLLNNKESTNKIADTSSPQIEIVPGREIATLTLSDGSTVQLGEAGRNMVVDGNTTLDVTGDMLDYRQAKDAEAHIHKLRVPLGGTYHIQLADGTKVWLNADSELEFPASFVGNERPVKVRGEAYFEIAKDPSRPFKVEVGDTEVEALGTAFNINTHLYQGKIKTILTEGKIKVSTNGEYKVIEHGYETISGQGNITIGKADLEEALAWKDGYFYFNSKSLKEVLEDVARWYKVDVDIRPVLSDKRYVGGIKKSESIAAVCSVLSDLTSYNIALENKKLVVR
ncbi:DUF4974 domain-containing protein [Parapedobacter sp. SGR-10]|uniref:FecR domain-containing protein n=1 Tax=Parapedobacter sp. SGR-10 TaxID=2710879 RepID=UPI0013D1AF8F|nr:FecR domain-containing protein [Parapedobacter sp. SGR-10]NGF56421.1 DUF4974 domain-containing protein [Parapedobacter sp. SGR-10]